ncbi:MAG: hypothetical protein NW200_11320 [Hyphomonadaceae bacterium]|nr:hypothetical protein [Hyphomonadaceae bacterium]
MRTIIAVTALALAITVGTTSTPAPLGQAAAQEGGLQARLRAADANKDGQLTKAEAVAGRERAFAAMDTDGDGFITEAERAAVRAKAGKGRGGGREGGGDADGDGKISRAEFLGAPYPLFERLDANRDDVLDAEELAVARGALAKRKQGTP